MYNFPNKVHIEVGFGLEQTKFMEITKVQFNPKFADVFEKQDFIKTTC